MCVRYHYWLRWCILPNSSCCTEEVVMERRDIILTAIFGTFGAIGVIIGLCLVAWRYLWDKRSKDLDSDCDNGIDIDNIRSIDESQQYLKKNGILNFKTPLITTKKIG
ncbi:hypothetical protein KQX54_011280 [Cotesia glomerata]|uniref:Uncharacterized protein n=1 Tax=Cotesia glomerata TaxID=32391 RepID=A0AAV7HXB0_COTGL|nr:hypothetical protein KQX54_011280 [Cotesia glomerata]